MKSVWSPLALALLGVAMLGIVPARAQVPAGMQQQARHIASLCRADYETLCHGVMPGGGRILACLQAHSARALPRLPQSPAAGSGAQAESFRHGRDAEVRGRNMP